MQKIQDLKRDDYHISMCKAKYTSFTNHRSEGLECIVCIVVIPLPAVCQNYCFTAPPDNELVTSIVACRSWGN